MRLSERGGGTLAHASTQAVARPLLNRHLQVARKRGASIGFLVLCALRATREPAIRRRGALRLDLLLAEGHGASITNALALAGVERGRRQLALALVLSVLTRSQRLCRIGCGRVV